mmetsp:Transcript_2257/g.8043  ORF Transcript_2257/g.8043 Transcript_2257/m.8043 type:complete len:497 (+) Transcript_2257:32-1522(+)
MEAARAKAPVPSAGFLKRMAESLFIKEEAVQWRSLDTGHGKSTIVTALVDDSAADKLSTEVGARVPPHLNIVSVGWAERLGTEAVVRIPLDDEAEDEHVHCTASYYALALRVQQSVKYRANETAQYAGWTADVWQAGASGALLVADPIITGNGSLDEGFNFIEEGPLADEDGWPAHFLCTHPLLPNEWTTAQGVRAANYAHLVHRYWSPVFLSTPRRCTHFVIPGFRNAVEELRATVPSRYLSDEADMQVFLRKGGRELDLVLSKVSVTHLLSPLEEVFRRPVVPLGSRVGMEAHGKHAIVRFHCHEDNGDPVTAENARFNLDRCLYHAFEDLGGVQVPETDKERAELALLPLSKIEELGMTRRMEFTVFAPKEFMAHFMRHLRDICGDHRPPNSGPRGLISEGIVLETPSTFPGTVPPGGVLDGLVQVGKGPEDPKCRLRILGVPMGYQLRPYELDDDGILHPSMEELGLVKHAHVYNDDRPPDYVVGYFKPLSN